MAGRFANRRAVITGGASGIGAGVAARLAAEGAVVAIWDLNPAGVTAEHVEKLDVTDPDAVQRAEIWSRVFPRETPTEIIDSKTPRGGGSESKSISRR